jgi:hypothetical protein
MSFYLLASLLRPASISEFCSSSLVVSALDVCSSLSEPLGRDTPAPSGGHVERAGMIRSRVQQ